jgi:hypothetical protein
MGLFDAIGDIAGAFIGNDAAKDATKAGVKGTEQQIAYERETRDLGLAINAPQRQAGYTALAGLMDMVGLSRGGAGAQGAPLLPGQLAGRSYMEQPKEFTALFNRGYTGRFKNFTPKDWTDFQNLRYTDPSAFAAEAEKMGYSDNRGRPGSHGTRFDFNKHFEKQGGAAANVPDMAGMPKYNWQTDPGYQFRLQEGQRNLEASAFARGGGMSGGLAKASMDWGQNIASAEYGNVFNRLATIAGYGTNANNASTNIVGTTGGGMADAAGMAGMYRASGQLGQGNAWGTLAGQAGGWADDFFGGGGGGIGSYGEKLSGYGPGGP